MKPATTMMVATVFAAISTVASAQPGGPGMGHRGPGLGPGGRMGPPPLERVLELTAEQRQAVAVLRAEEREAVEPLFEQIRALHEKLRTSLESEAPDASTVGQFVIDAHALQQLVGSAHEAFREKLHALLTPEQEEKLKALPARGPGRRPGRPFMPFGPPPPPPPAGQP